MKSSFKILKLALCLVLVLPLTGCLEGELFVDIRSDGSATVATSLGLESETKSSLNIQNEDIAQQFFEAYPHQESVRISTWVDGDYEWVKFEQDFETLEEVNAAVSELEMFTIFSLTRETGFFQNQITLYAVYDLSALGGWTASLLGFSGGDTIDFRLIARMPGTLKETNGLSDFNDPNLLTWNARYDGPTPILARSITWNYLNIGLFTVGILLAALLILYMLFFLIRKTYIRLEESSPVVGSPVRSLDENGQNQTIAADSKDVDNG